MKALLALLTWLLMSVTLHAQEAVFYWDMETNVPNMYKTDNTVRYYADIEISDSAAYAGTRSLRNQGEWAEAMFDNPTLVDEWAPVSEGSFEYYWRYVAPWDGKMHFQITGKDASLNEDTNDGFSVSMRGSTVGQFSAGMGWNDFPDSTYKTASVRNNTAVTMVNGQWYRFRVKYKVGIGISMQIDDLPPVTTSNVLGPTGCTAWHQLLIGNDTYATGIQYIDEFRVWSTWLDSFPVPVELTSFTAAAALNGIELSWNTATESGNLGWNIYRQLPGESGFSKINTGIVPGNGTTAQPHQYSFIDATLTVNQTTLVNYYLEQVDLSGATERSRTVSVMLSPTGIKRVLPRARLSENRSGRLFSIDGRVLKSGVGHSGVYLQETNGTIRKTLFIK
jgi:hypothetical protein